MGLNAPFSGNHRETGSRLAVITGASGGIGFELAREFARNGFDLLLTSQGDGLAEARSQLQAYGNRVEAFTVSLGHYAGVEAFVEKVQGLDVPIDALILNAGVCVGGDFARETELGWELNLIQVNIVSAVHLAKRLLPDMIKRGRGRVLFTSSISAIMPGPYEAVYAASKSFLRSFSEALREELRGTGISVTALMPGPTETNIFHRAGLDHTIVGKMKKDDPRKVASDGYRAMMADRDKVIAGAFRNRFFGLAEIFLSLPLLAKVHRLMSKPRSAL